ncbi:MAG TPA: response regulator transcription factor [Ktedonosporobacter sp.]|nr:response regulator transcription factor [Ktedonosporobacter sp.]
MVTISLLFSGYLIKDTNRETLFHAIRTAARGETLLQPELLTRLLARAELSSPSKASSEQPTRRDSLKMTDREREILAGVARGERNKEIAARLGISEPTVKSHLVNIYGKLRVDSRASAVAIAIERGLISPNRPARF